MQGSRERVKRQIKQRKSDTNSKVKPDSLSWEISNNGATNIGRKNDSKPKLEDIYPKRWPKINDLCPEDKRRVRGLIEEVARLSSEKEKMESEMTRERNALQGLLGNLQAQNHKVMEEKRELESELASRPYPLWPPHHHTAAVMNGHVTTTTLHSRPHPSDKPHLQSLPLRAHHHDMPQMDSTSLCTASTVTLPNISNIDTNSRPQPFAADSLALEEKSLHDRDSNTSAGACGNHGHLSPEVTGVGERNEQEAEEEEDGFSSCRSTIATQTGSPCDEHCDDGYQDGVANCDGGSGVGVASCGGTSDVGVVSHGNHVSVASHDEGADVGMAGVGRGVAPLVDTGTQTLSYESVGVQTCLWTSPPRREVTIAKDDQSEVKCARDRSPPNTLEEDEHSEGEGSKVMPTGAGLMEESHESDQTLEEELLLCAKLQEDDSSLLNSHHHHHHQSKMAAGTGSTVAIAPQEQTATSALSLKNSKLLSHRRHSDGSNVSCDINISINGPLTVSELAATSGMESQRGSQISLHHHQHHQSVCADQKQKYTADITSSSRTERTDIGLTYHSRPEGNDNDDDDDDLVVSVLNLSPPGCPDRGGCGDEGCGDVNSLKFLRTRNFPGDTTMSSTDDHLESESCCVSRTVDPAVFLNQQQDKEERARGHHSHHDNKDTTTTANGLITNTTTTRHGEGTSPNRHDSLRLVGVASGGSPVGSYNDSTRKRAPLILSSCLGTLRKEPSPPSEHDVELLESLFFTQ